MAALIEIVAHKLDNAVREANRVFGYPDNIKPTVVENDDPKAYILFYPSDNVVEVAIQHLAKTSWQVIEAGDMADRFAEYAAASPHRLARP